MTSTTTFPRIGVRHVLLMLAAPLLTAALGLIAGCDSISPLTTWIVVPTRAAVLAAMAGVAMVTISLLLVRALRARPRRIALVASLTVLPALAAANLPGGEVVHETVRVGSRDFAVATGWSLACGDMVVLTERVKVTPLFEKFTLVTAWQDLVVHPCWTISPAVDPAKASSRRPRFELRPDRFLPVVDTLGRVWAARRSDPDSGATEVFVGFDVARATVVHATRCASSDGRCACVPGLFDLIGDQDSGSEAEVGRTADSIADIATYFRGWDSTDTLLTLIPHDLDLVRAMDAANPWVRQSAERLARAGTPEMYPESWRRLRRGR